MKNKQEFDRLAKQKMSERDFPFDEAHWQLASQQIARSKRSRFVHLFWLLIPAAAAWIWWVSVSSNQNESQHLALSPSTQEVSEPRNQNTLPADGPVSEQSAKENTSVNETSTPNETASTDKKTNNPQVEAADVKPLRRSDSGLSLTAEENKQKRSNEKKNAQQGVISPDGVPANAKTASASLNEREPDEASSTVSNSVTEKDGDLEYVQTSMSSASGKAESVGTFVLPESGDYERLLAIPAQMGSRPLHTLKAQEVELDNTRVSLPRFGPLFKFSVSGGLWNTQASFSAEKEEAWMKTSRSTWQENLGLEAIISGQHLGAGLGIHYTSYGEEVDASAVFNTYSETFKNWFLVAVDTTVLVITDSIWNGSQMTYTGYNEVRTIHVLESETGTITTQEVMRDERKMYNKVSYIEVPLLLDAHVGSGPWTFGLRGGPSLAMQIYRKGSLPLPGDAGYFTLDEETTRRWMPGYQARFYLHYKFSPQWALGIEPGIRGLLGNSLTSSGLDRRSHAFGALFSLNYLWRKK